jgi:hypothetical protein
VLFCYVACVPVIVAQIIAALALIRRVREMAEAATADPFALLTQGSSEKTTQVSSALEQFSSGFSMSGPASFGIAAVVAGMAMVPPYRYRSRMFLVWSVGAQLALVGWSVTSVIIGSRNFDAGALGTWATALYGIPVMVFALSPTVRAWSVRFEPPPPPLPGDLPQQV